MGRMNLQAFLRLRALRRRAKAALSHGRTTWSLRRDLLPEGEGTAFLGALETLARERRGSDPARLGAALEAAEAAIASAAPARPLPGARELVETLVVALGVAMTFRAFFFQPFKIPTGSMQPTLFGHHSEACDAPTVFDRMPWKPLKWLVTGKWYVEAVAPDSGPLIVYTDRNRAPGYVYLGVSGATYRIPQDAFDRGEVRIPEHAAFGMADAGGGRILHARGRASRGDRLWSGYSIAGDHVFVNRMKWYFRPPRRGEIVVFSTDGNPHLPPEQFYIKRLAGLPGESVSFDPPYLVIDGVRVTEPATIRRVEDRGPAETPGHSYPGYGYASAPIFRSAGTGRDARAPLGASGDILRLGPDAYLPLGDNTVNSYDGRYWGPVGRRRLLGSASCVYWPISVRWGGVE